jgi:hypothetical protein
MHARAGHRATTRAEPHRERHERGPAALEIAPHDDGSRAAGRPPYSCLAPGELAGDRGRVHDPPLMPTPGNLTISCPELPALAVGGGDGTLSAQCPAAAAPDRVRTSANPRAGQRRLRHPGRRPDEPSPPAIAATVIIGRSPRPSFDRTGPDVPRSP